MSSKKSTKSEAGETIPVASQSDRSRQIQAIMDKVRKDNGEESIMTFAHGTNTKIDSIPTGSLSLDMAIGIGGYPKGRIVEIYGPESSGKTTLCLHGVAEAQKRGLFAAFVDAEHALDVTYARNLGVNIDELLISQPSSGEQALNVVEALVTAGNVSFIVVDSVAALTPQAELDGEMGDAHIGLQARLMGQALRKLAALVNKAGIILIFTNQIRTKVGVLYGSPETTPGGNALKFYASLRIDVRRRDRIKEKGGGDCGNKACIKIVKNKVSPPYQEVELDIVWGKGIDAAADILALGIKLKIVEQKGAWLEWVVGTETLIHAQGLLKAADELRDNPAVCIRLEQTIRATLGNHQ